MAYSLRFFQTTDQAYWVALHHEAYKPRVTPLWGWDEAKQDAYALNEMNTPYSGQFIIQQNGTDVGYLSYQWEETTGLYLSNLVIEARYRGKGLGKEILTDLITWAHRLHQPIHLRTFENNPAKALYESLGFAVYKHSPEDKHYYLRLAPTP